MASTYRVLGQVSAAATTNTDLYVVPSATSTVCSTMVIANRGATGATFRVAVRPAGAAIANQHYLVYDSIISANDSIFLTLGISLAATDVITVYSSNANLSFSIFGSEIA
jgi:hypothetical protein